MAAAPTPDRPMRVRLDVPDEHLAAAEWALEALMARARILEWERVEDGGDVDLELPAEAAQWDFRGDREPDPEWDPLAFTFWWLARVEELLAPEDAFDEHGRFRYARSAAGRRRQPHGTPVDDLAAELAEPLGAWRVDVPLGEPSWRVVATHDIDLPWRWTRVGRRRAVRQLRDDLKRLRLVAVLRALAALAAIPIWRVRRTDPWDNFEAITSLERAERAESTSYVLVGRHAPEDGDAELHDRGRSWLGAARGSDLGDRVGLHGSYTASDTPGRLSAELSDLGSRTGAPHPDHRFHYLRHRPVDAWPVLERAGMRSDSSLGFAECPGFRAGTAHPFRAWDHAAGAPLELVVIPLAVMDASFDRRYLHLPRRRDRREHAEAMLDAVRLRGGCASLLLHNDRLCNSTDDGWTSIYRHLLRHVRATGGRACTAAEAVAAYRALLPARRGGVRENA